MSSQNCICCIREDS